MISGPACARCGFDLADTFVTGRRPCPRCGETKRVHHVEISINVVVANQIRGVLRPGRIVGRGRRATAPLEFRSGGSLSRRLGRYIQRHQVWNRLRDRYVEWFSDPRTGYRWGFEEHPLSEHDGTRRGRPWGKEPER